MGFSGVISTTSPKSSAYDVSARGFFIAQSDAGVTLTDTQKNATNQLVIDLKAAGLWSKFKALYPFVGGTATSHKFNLITPADTDAAFRLSFVGGGTHSSNGYLPNGTNAYADTFLVPSTVGLGQNSTHISYYSRTNNNVGIDMGATAVTGDPGQLYIYIRDTGNTYSRVNSYGTFTVAANTDGRGMYIATRLTSSDANFFKNTTKTTLAVTSTGVPIRNIEIGALVDNGVRYYGSKESAFASIGDGLTDLESQLFYQITEKYQVALGRNVNATQSFYYNAAYNNETNAFLFSTQITDATIQTATNTLVSDLKTAGVFTKMKAIYPMVGGTATTHKFNLVNAQDTNAAFRLNFVGGWTHSSNGALPNGTNAYADTFLVPNAILLQNSTTLSFYNRTTTINNGCNIGSVKAGYLDMLYIFNSSINYSLTVNQNTSDSVTTTPLGFSLAKRTSSTNFVFQKNSTQTTITKASSGRSDTSIFIGALHEGTNTVYYQANQCAFASIGDGLTDAEALSFYNAVQTFNTTLGRQV